jgi:hypothetical protein
MSDQSACRVLQLPDLPDWADLRTARPPGGGVVVAALVAGALADLAVRSGGWSLVRALPRLGPAPQGVLLEDICSVPARATGGWAAWNRSERNAIAARNQVCR